MAELKNVDFTSYIGRDLGGVTILRELGRGSMGVVFVAFQKSLKRQVAVKGLAKSLVHSERASNQFRDEAEIIAGLSHPNIMPIFEMGENADIYYQVMQLIVGSDLRTVIKNQLKYPVVSKRVLPRERTLDIIVQVLDGLAYAHDDGIVHQDIKPANILLEEKTQRPIIADFGIARTAQMEYSSGGVIVGTPTYLAPEQARAQVTDQRADVYAAGMVLFEMLAGNLPIRKEPVKDLLLRKMRQPETFFLELPSKVSPLIDAGLERILLKALHPDIGQRYQDCRQFRADIRAYTDELARAPIAGGTKA